VQHINEFQAFPILSQRCAPNSISCLHKRPRANSFVTWTTLSTSHHSHSNTWKVIRTKLIWVAQVSADILGTTVGFSHYSSKGVDWVFVEHGSYDRPGGLYGDESGVYGDNQALLLPKLALFPPCIAELCQCLLVPLVCLANSFGDIIVRLGVIQCRRQFSDCFK